MQVVNWNGTAYNIPDAGDVNWPALTNFLVALGTNAAVAIQMKQAIRVATTTPVTVSATTDFCVVTALSAPGAVAVNLPAGANGQLFAIIDGTGDAASNNITITPNGVQTIKGAANLVLNHNSQAVILQYSSTGTDWKVLANVLYPGTITSADITGTIAPSKGGTGVANNDAATLTRSGNHALTLTTTNTTGVTLPTTGTLATLAGSETLTNKVLTGNTIADFLSAPGQTITAPTATSTLATLALVETLSFKTLVDPIVRGDLLLQNPSGSQPTLSLSEDPDNGTNYVRLQAAAAMAANYTLTMPSAQGLSGQTLVNDGAGAFSWGSAGATGQLNLISNPNDATNWSETGSVFATPATTTSAGDLPLSGVINTAIQFVATNNGTEATDYNSISFTTPAAVNSVLGIYVYMRPGSGFVASEWTMSVYQSTTRQNLSTDSSSVTALPNLTGMFMSSFYALPSTAYTLRFARTSGSGSATLNVTDVLVTPGVPNQGAAVNAAMPNFNMTYSSGFGSTSNSAVTVTRLGTMLRVFGKFTAGTVAGATAYLQLPSGYTIDSSVLPNTATQRLGVANRVPSSSVNPASNNMVIFYDGSTTNQVFITVDATSNVFTKVNVNSPFATGDVVSFDFTIPQIAEWAGSGTVNLVQNNVEYAAVGGTWDADSSTTVYGPSGVAMGGTLTTARNKTITWQTPVKATDRIQIWASKDQLNWYPMNGAVIGANDCVGNSISSTGAYVGCYWRSGATQYETLVLFAEKMNMANDDSPSTNWPSSNAYWVATKSSAGIPVGFGLADTSGNSGLVAPYTVGTGVVYGGTYTPTGSNTSNCSVTPRQCVYSRVGKVVTISGTVDVDITAGGGYNFQLSLPISSNFTSQYDAAGVGNRKQGSTYQDNAFIQANTTNDTLYVEGSGTDTDNEALVFTCQYQIL